MSKGIIHKISKVAELENPARIERQNASDGQPAEAELPVTRTGYRLSDEFACLLRALGGKRNCA